MSTDSSSPQKISSLPFSHPTTITTSCFSSHLSTSHKNESKRRKIIYTIPLLYTPVALLTQRGASYNSGSSQVHEAKPPKNAKGLHWGWGQRDAAVATASLTWRLCILRLLGILGILCVLGISHRLAHVYWVQGSTMETNSVHDMLAKRLCGSGKIENMELKKKQKLIHHSFICLLINYNQFTIPHPCATTFNQALGLKGICA